MTVKFSAIACVIIAMLFYFTTFAEKRAKETKNLYTLNHLKLN